MKCRKGAKQLKSALVAGTEVILVNGRVNVAFGAQVLNGFSHLVLRNVAERAHHIILGRRGEGETRGCKQSPQPLTNATPSPPLTLLMDCNTVLCKSLNPPPAICADAA